MKSIVSYPDRGKWGNNKYRGNCTGHIIKDLLEHFKPADGEFVEVFAGGGTGLDVAKSMGYKKSIHLNLNGRFGDPFNALTDDLPQGASLVFSHPPYHTMIKYSGNMWGDPHPDDLSRCGSYEEFLYKINLVNAKIYNSLKNGGRHAFLIGDMRSNGKYYSIQKDMAWYGDLESHVIKAQHNFHSGSKEYNGRFIPIVHEHLLIFKKNSIWAIPIQATKKLVKDLRNSVLATWRDLVQAALEQLKGKASLNDINELLKDTEKAKNNAHWQAKIRQTLQLGNEFSSSERGVWGLSVA